MPKTYTKLVPAPVKGLNYPQAGDELSPGDMSDCRNVSIQNGLIQKRHGYKLFGTNLPLSGAIMGFDEFRKMSGAKYLLCMTTKDIYRWDSNNKEWDLITENTSIDDCEDNPALWTAMDNVTVSRETSDVKEGSSAVKLTIDAAFGNGLIAFHNKSIGDISAYNHVRFWIKSSVSLSAGDLQFAIDDTSLFSSPSSSPSPSVSPSVSPSASPSFSASPSISVSPSLSPSVSPSFSPSVSPSVSPSLSPSASPSVSVSPSLSPSASPSASASPSFSVSPSVSPSLSPSVSPSASPAPSPLRELDLPALTADTWTLCLLDMRLLGLTSDLNDIASIAIQATTDFGACELIIDDFQVYDCFTGDDDQFFSFDHIRKVDQSDFWWCCTNGVDDIKKYDGNEITDLSADAPKSIVLRQFKDYLFALNTVESGNPMHQRARWPNTADPTNWLTGNASYKDLPGADWIKEALRYKGDYLVILKDKSLWLGYASLDDDIFKFDNKVPEIGCASGRTAICLGEQIVVMGWVDVYVFDGIEAEPIAGRIRKELFRIIKTEEIDRCFGTVLDEEKEYWLHVVSSSSSYPDIAWILNHEVGAWTRHEFADYLTAYGKYYIEEAPRIGDLTMKVRDMTWKVGDRRLLSLTPTLIFGDKDGYTYEYSQLENDDNGTAIDAYFDTKDYILGGADARMRIVRLDVYYTGASLEIYYSSDKGVSWTLLTTLGTSTSLELPNIIKFRLNKRQIRWRFRNAESGQTFSFQRAVMYYQKAGKRLLA